MWFYMFDESVASSVAGPVEPRAKQRSRRMQPWAGLGLLVSLVSIGAIGCDELRGEHPERDGWFVPGRGSGERGAFGRGGRERGGFWHHGRGPRGAGSPVDAGADAGAADAGDAADGGTAAVADAGGDAASASGPVADAGVDAAVAALGDDQLVLLADTLLAGELDRAGTALPSLADADVLAFAESSSDELQAARATLATLAAAIDLSPAASGVADDVRADNDGALEPLAAPDAGGLDAVFLTSQTGASSRALELLEPMIAAADSPELRAELVVLRALQRQLSDRARELGAALGG
jgi:uncharacterized protein DUF4142